MQNFPENTQQDSTLNLEFALKYAEKVFEAKNKTIDNLNTRSGTFLGFSGVLLKFGLDLHDNCPMCLLLKISTLGLLCLSILFNALTLLANSKGYIMQPRKLMSDEYFKEEHNIIKARITNTLIEALEELDLDAIKKSQYLNSGIICITLATLAFAANGIITSFFKECI